MDLYTEKRRHSAAHVLAMAVLRLFPNAKLGIGPVTKDGFYHDFELPRALTWEDVKQIEAEMNMIIQEDLRFSQVWVSRDQAFEILMMRGQIYKSELLQEITDEEISFYKTGEEFVDLCRGPHVDSTNKVGAVKLLEISEVHWKNNPDRPHMQRVSGVAFPTPAELNTFLKRQQEIQTRDFRRYAEDLGYIIPADDIPIYGRGGTIALRTIQNKLMELLMRDGYAEVLVPPHIPETTSAVEHITHWIDHIYKAKNRSYRSLPYKALSIARYQSPNPTKVGTKPLAVTTELVARTFIDPLKEGSELRNILQILLEMTRGLQTKPTAHIYAANLDAPALRLSTDILSREGVSQTQVIDASTAQDSLHIHFVVNDSLQREWEIASLVYAPVGPEYVNSNGETAHTHTFTLHITIEQIMAYFLEELEGGFPFWAAPTQVALVPISGQQDEYADHIATVLENQGLRTTIDNRQETMQARIRDAELKRVPVILIVGEKEENSKAVSVRLRNRQELGMVSEEMLIESLLQQTDL